MFRDNEVALIRLAAGKLPREGSDPPTKSQLETLVEKVEICDIEEVLMDMDARLIGGKFGGDQVRDMDIAKSLKELLCAIWNDGGRQDIEEKRIDSANALRYVNKLRGNNSWLSCGSSQVPSRSQGGQDHV